jgi:hypothetical protein
MNNNIAPMPTQNPWAWVGMGMGTQCRALLQSLSRIHVVIRRASPHFRPILVVKGKLNGDENTPILVN